MSILKALDPLVLHLTETILGRKGKGAALSFGESLDGTRDVLIVAAKELTDLLSVIPAAHAIRKRFRLARVHVLAAGPCAEVLEARPEIFEAIRWDPDAPLASRETVALSRKLAAHPFDLAIAVDSGEGRVARTLAALSGARLRVGIHPEGADPTLNLVVAAPLVDGYRPVQSLEFLSFLGMPREALAPSWEIPKVDREYSQRLLNLRRNGREGWLLGVDPGPSRSGRRASPEKLAWMVDRIVEQRGALPIILTSSSEKSYVDELRACMKSRPLEASQRGIRDVLSFTKCCDLFLSGNTDLFHLAVALDVPTVGLFGREDEDRWIPPDSAENRILRLRPGERVLEREFLEVVDDVRRSGVVHLPLRIALAEEGRRDSVPEAEAAGERDARRA